MAKKNRMDLENLYSGILFCISLVALIIACLAYTKKNQGGEYYKDTLKKFGTESPSPPCPSKYNGMLGPGFKFPCGRECHHPDGDSTTCRPNCTSNSCQKGENCWPAAWGEPYGGKCRPETPPSEQPTWPPAPPPGVPCGGLGLGGGPCKSDYKCCPCPYYNEFGIDVMCAGTADGVTGYCCGSQGSKCKGYIPGHGTLGPVLGTCEGGGWGPAGPKCIADSDCNWCQPRGSDSCPSPEPG